MTLFLFHSLQLIVDTDDCINTFAFKVVNCLLFTCCLLFVLLQHELRSSFGMLRKCQSHITPRHTMLSQNGDCGFQTNPFDNLLVILESEEHSCLEIKLAE